MPRLSPARSPTRASVSDRTPCSTASSAAALSRAASAWSRRSCWVRRAVVMAGAYQTNLRVDQQICEDGVLPYRPLEVPMIEIDDRDRYGAGGIAGLDFPAEPEPEISRPNTAPAYYLGHPARLWITVMRPRRKRTTSRHAMQAVTGDGKLTPSRYGGQTHGTELG